MFNIEGMVTSVHKISKETEQICTIILLPVEQKAILLLPDFWEDRNNTWHCRNAILQAIQEDFPHIKTIEVWNRYHG